jgi:hypothetical protein
MLMPPPTSVSSGLAQGDGGSQAADTGADNGNLERWWPGDRAGHVPVDRP